MGIGFICLSISSLLQCHWQLLLIILHQVVSVMNIFLLSRNLTKKKHFLMSLRIIFQCDASYQISAGVSETSPLSLCFIILYLVIDNELLRTILSYSWLRFFYKYHTPFLIFYVSFFLRCQWSKRRHLCWKPHTLFRKLQWLLYTWKMWIHLFHSEGFLPVSPECLQNMLEIAIMLNQNAL